MKDQPAGGHVFNMDGAGADGNATPRFAAYGATKRSLQQVRARARPVCSVPVSIVAARTAAGASMLHACHLRLHLLCLCLSPLCLFLSHT